MRSTTDVLFLHQLTSSTGRKTYFQSKDRASWELPRLFEEFTASKQSPSYTNFVSWIALHSELRSVSIFDRQASVITDELVWPYDKD